MYKARATRPAGMRAPRMAQLLLDEPKGSGAERGSVSHSEQEVTLRGSRSESQERLKRIDEPLSLVHHHPGYLRIRAGAFLQLEDDSSVVTAAQTGAEAVPGFRSWSLNPKTGSVVVEYDPGTLDADDLLKHIAKSAGLRGVEISASRKMNRQKLVSAFLDTVQDVNQVVNRLASERADLRELVPIALAATSVVSFVLNKKRGRLPTWSSALYHSYRIFMQWHQREVRTRERASRQREASGDSGNKSGNSR
jgi:Heavy metal associated domain 2